MPVAGPALPGDLQEAVLSGLSTMEAWMLNALAELTPRRTSWARQFIGSIVVLPIHFLKQAYWPSYMKLTLMPTSGMRFPASLLTLISGDCPCQLRRESPGRCPDVPQYNSRHHKCVPIGRNDCDRSRYKTLKVWTICISKVHYWGFDITNK